MLLFALKSALWKVNNKKIKKINKIECFDKKRGQHKMTNVPHFWYWSNVLMCSKNIDFGLIWLTNNNGQVKKSKWAHFLIWFTLKNERKHVPNQSGRDWKQQTHHLRIKLQLLLKWKRWTFFYIILIFLINFFQWHSFFGNQTLTAMFVFVYSKSICFTITTLWILNLLCNFAPWNEELWLLPNW